MLRQIGPMELLVILLVALLLFGGKKIPEIARGLGKGIRDFKSSLGGQGEAAEEDAKNLAKPEQKGPVSGTASEPPKT